MAPAAAKKRCRDKSNPLENTKKEPKATAKKKARVEDEVIHESNAVPVDPFSEACEEVFVLLDSDEGLSEATRDMLRTAAPFSLKTRKDERHEFQERMVQTLDDIVRAVESKEREKVEAVQKKVDEASESARAAADALSLLTRKIEELTAARDAANQNVKDADDELAERKKAFEDTKEAARGLEAAHANDVTELSNREEVVDSTWAALKAGSLTGKQWREKAKKIEIITSILGELQAEDSLLSSLPIALKVKPDERGVFANRAIDFTDESLTSSILAIRGKISSHSIEVAEHEKRVADAEDALRAKTDALGERQNELIASDNNLLNASQEQSKAAETVQATDKQSKELSSALAASQQAFAEVTHLRSRFEALATGGAASLEPTCASVEVLAAVTDVAAEVSEAVPC